VRCDCTKQYKVELAQDCSLYAMTVTADYVFNLSVKILIKRG